MLKNKNLKIIKVGDYNKVIITRGKNFKNLEKYFLENRENFYSLNNNLQISIGKKLTDLILFNIGTDIIDIERNEEEFEEYFYGDIRIINLNKNALYSEFNAPICTKIEENDTIISLVNTIGYKAISKLSLDKIESLSEIVKKLKNKEKYNGIKAVLYCNKEAIITTREILKFKEKFKKMEIKEDGIIHYDINREYVINIPKLFCDILNQYEVNDIKIIKYMEEDVDNLMLFI